MSLRLPAEIVAEEFLPTFRAMLAVELDDRGLTQQEIADHIGVTQASVSNYVHESVTVEERFASDPRTVDTAERVAEGLATGEYDGVDAMAEVLELIDAFVDRGPICERHEELMPELAGMGCDLCVRGGDAAVQAERDVLANVRQATRMLATGPGIAGLVPNVGTNVGMALPGATEPTEVAAVPGRIYAMRGRVEVPANPEFGASRHVASTILAVTAHDDRFAAALNVATDDRLLTEARDRGIDPLGFDPSYEDRRAELEERFGERGSVPRVLYHEGAFGIEPVTYVLGERATDAAALLIDLADAAGIREPRVGNGHGR